MPNPKTKTLKDQKRQKKTHYKATAPTVTSCSNCGSSVQYHRVSLSADTIEASLLLRRKLQPDIVINQISSSMKIGIDVMGGDFAPESIIEGALDSLQHLSAGDELCYDWRSRCHPEKTEKNQTPSSGFSIVHTSQVIEMGDIPSKAYSQKPDSSIGVGYRLLKEKIIDGFLQRRKYRCNARGSTSYSECLFREFSDQLLLLLSRLWITAIQFILDVGINPDCKPDVLLQYGILGSIYARYVLEIENPTVKTAQYRGRRVKRDTFS